MTFEDKFKVLYPDWDLSVEVHREVEEVIEELELARVQISR